MAPYQPDIPPHVAQIIRHLPPDVKQSVKQALRALSLDPFSGQPLLGDLKGLWKYKARRFRIVYEIDPQEKLFRIFAVGHRKEVYEEITERLIRTKLR